MIISDTHIIEERKKGSIVIEPFFTDCLGPNSYDIHLGEYYGRYRNEIINPYGVYDFQVFKIPSEGLTLYPNEFILASTLEYTETHDHVPFIEGISSLGRLGVEIHATAGKGDVGFCGHWTLEISCKIPIVLYAGMRIGQLIFFICNGYISKSYTDKKHVHYANINDNRPIASRYNLSRNHISDLRL